MSDYKDTYTTVDISDYIKDTIFYIGLRGFEIEKSLHFLYRIIVSIANKMLDQSLIRFI